MATNYNSYTPTEWAPNTPITQNKMEKLEEGVQENRDDAIDLNSRVNGLSTRMTDELQQLNTTLSNEIAQNVASGRRAMTELQKVIVLNPSTQETTYGLDNMKSDLENAISVVQQSLGTKTVVSQDTQEAQTVPAYNNANTVYNAIENLISAIGRDANGNLAYSYNANPSTNNTILKNLSTIQVDWNNARGSDATLTDHLGNMAADTIRAQQTANYSQEQIQNAMRTDLVDENQLPISDSLARRFNDIVAALAEHTDDISSINSNIDSINGDIDTNYVKKADVRNDFVSPDTNLPLSAAKGKELREMIGGNFTTASTVASAIATAQSNAETRAIGYADTNKVDKTNIYNDLDYVPALDATDDKVLDARQGKALKDLIDGMDTAYKAADTALDGRLTTAEGAIATLNGNASTEGSVLNTVNTRIADVVAEAPEAFDTLKEIADWIGTHSTSALEMQQDITDNADAIASLQDTITDENTGLAATRTQMTTAVTNLDGRLDAIDGGTALTGAKTLATRVSEAESAITTLQNEPKSATVIIDNVTYDSSTGNPVIDNPSTDADYLLKKDDKYYYWKYIKTGSNPDTFEWALISSAGGSGNSSGFDMTETQYSDLEEHTQNTDYYVSYDDGTVHHYRYVPDTVNGGLKQIEIGQFTDLTKIKRYNIGLSEEGEGENAVTYLNLYQYDYSESSNTDTERAFFNRVALPKGGGGSATGGVRKRLTRIGDQQVQNIVGSTVMLQVFYSYWTTTVDDNNQVHAEESSAGTYELRNGNTVIETGTIPSGAFGEVINGYKANTDGYYQFDVTQYCKAGDNRFELTVTTNGETQGKDWTITLIDLRLESDAPANQLINNAESFSFPYTPFGAISKQLFVKIDDTLVTPEDGVTLSAVTAGRPTTYTIQPQEHGVHKIEMYLTADVGGIGRTTSSLIREYIWYDENDEEQPVLLASSYDGQTITAKQYSTIQIPYQVYKKGVEQINVEYYLNDETTPFDNVTLDRVNVGTLSYLAVNENAKKLTIKVDDQTVVINLSITVDQSIDIAPVSGAIIDFDPTSLTNSSANRLPSWTVGTGANATTYSLTASDNFNWSNDSSGGGYKDDTDGKCLVIKAGTYIDLNYPLFSGDRNNNILTRGAEFKVVFKTKAVRTADAVWLQSVGKLFEKDIGLQLGVHSGWLKTTKAVNESVTIEPDENGVITINNTSYNIWKPNTAYAVDQVVVLWDESDEDNHQLIFRCIQAWDDTHDTFLNAKGKVQTDYWLSVGKISTNISSTDSYLYMPYSEQDKIELDINVNKYNAAASTNFIMSYEDGVPSKVYAYSAGSGGDGLYHSNTIRIGSDDCDVYIYRLRIYNQQLGTADILQNFIADGRDIDEKIERYNRNCIYWDETQNRYFTSPSGSAHLDPIKLAEVMPDVKVLMLDTPIFTTSKKDFVFNSSLRCVQADGGNVYRSRGDADNWLFTNGFHSGQGTTSDNYGQSARNVDFLFEVDGEHWPTKSKNMGTYKPSDHPDYKSTVYVGKDASSFDGVSWTPTRDPKPIEICENWKEDQCKVSLTSTSVPNNYFNLKVNVASSENVNNALFQKRYDDFLVYTAPSQTRQIAKHRAAYSALGVNPNEITIKNSMEFVPAVLFVRENDPTLTKHVEFNDTNWHFYALGNIGDSKKTDYTRAYDPDDMNEFTCENSDNNTNNGQFQSGVFMYNDHEAIETNYNAWSDAAEYESGDIVVYDGMIYTCNTTATVGTWVSTEWTAAAYTNWTDQTKTPYFAPRVNPNPMDYTFPITPDQWNVQFNGQYLNRKHVTLIEEEFDGDHSFEFRYACCGDYRDGDLINDTTGDADAQFELNHGVVLAFYEWLITATPEQFVNEAPQWFVKSAMEFFYAYTHYYTMMDNRAKNTFWHFAKTNTYVEVSRPVKALLHVYEESADNGATWQKATGTEIDPAKKYRTQYAFDLWAYDMDTAAGIDNNGELSFPYGKEDDDYRVEGVPTSGYAFNGAGSIFWRRLKTTFASEIADVMNSAQNCFNAEDLIEEFDQFQSCFPEEVWRLDIERKYIRTFTGESIDNSITTGKKNPRFLTSMMQGRKKYQRRQWIRNQTLYFNSKYRLKDITIADNTVEFNVITPADKENAALTPNYDLKLTPYQDMYLNVTVGNGGPTPSLRAKAGKTYTIPIANYTAANFGETRIYIYGFSGISGVGNLASMYPYKFQLNALDHLKTLDIGTEVSGYVNANLTALPFTESTELPLLETLNIKNCHSLGGALSLNQANNLRTLEAAGTSITGVNLPEYTSIETLHLPSSVIELILYGARKLTDFKIYDTAGNIDYSSLFTLHVTDSDYSAEWYGNKEYKVGDCILLDDKYYRCTTDHTSVSNTVKESADATEWNAYLAANWLETTTPTLPVDWMAIATAMLSKQSTETEISLLRLNHALIQDMQTLEPFSDAKNNSQMIDLSGIIHVMGDWSSIEIANYLTHWPNIQFVTLPAKEVTRYRIVYKYDDYTGDDGELIEGEEIKTLYVRANTRIPDIAYGDDALIDEPTRAQTVRYSYTFGEKAYDHYVENSGWKAEGSEEHFIEMPLATRNMVIETYFTKTARRYQTKWFMKRGDTSTLVKTSAGFVEYGGGADLEAPTVPEIHAAGQPTAVINSLQGGVVNYSIFKGWETLPIEIHPLATDVTYNIYADWETKEMALGDLFADTSSLTPEQLFVYAHMTKTDRDNYANDDQIDVSQQVSFTLGHDSDEEGQMLIGPGGSLVDGILRLDITPTPRVSTIQPMREGNDAFTIMIDYSFNPNDPTRYNNKSAGILMSCYYYNAASDVISGFALYDNLNSNLGSLGPRVGFGNMFGNSSYSQAVGGKGTYHEARNVLVLRHPAGSSVLHVYSGLTSSNKISSDITATQIPWNNSTNNAYINFGQLTNATDDDYTNLKDVMAVGNGTIYQAKYWSKDLGVGECKRLAAWPHETVTFGIAQISTSPTNGTPSDNNPMPSLSLNTLTTSSYGHLNEDTSALSWASSTYRNIVNSHVILGLPTKLQAILSKPKVKYFPLIEGEDNLGAQTKTLANVVESKNDYLFFPSIYNLNISYSNYLQETNATFESSPYPWINSSDITLYYYNPNSGTVGSWDIINGDRGFYANLRFSIHPISTSYRIFRENTNSFSNGNTTTIQAAIQTGVAEIRTGDDFIDITGKSYMYVSNSDINQLGAQVLPNSGIFRCTAGGWIQGSGFWTRSMMVPDTININNANHFIYSNKSAGPVTGYNTSNAVSSSEGLGLNYSITI